MVSFKNTLVLLTSNIGSRVIAASSGGLAAFGSRRSLMGGGEEADEELSKAEQVKTGARRACCSWCVCMCVCPLFSRLHKRFSCGCMAGAVVLVLTPARASGPAEAL